MLRIGLIQMRCEKGAISQNLESIAGYLREAKERQIDIIGFPEMSISGYADPNRYPQAVIRLDGPEVQQFLDLTKGVPAVVLAGLIEEKVGVKARPEGVKAHPEGVKSRPEGKPFITQIVACDGQLLGWYRKVTIKDKEEEWFTPGENVPVFRCGPLTFGVAICADISNETVFAECARQNAQVVFELAAPGLYGEQATRNWQSGFEWWRGECREKLSAYARKYHQWIAVATQAGRTVDEDFPGGGYVFSPRGECLFETLDWSAGAVYLEIDLGGQQVVVI